MDLLMRGDTSSGIYEMTIRDPGWERTLWLRVMTLFEIKAMGGRYLEGSEEGSPPSPL